MDYSTLYGSLEEKLVQYFKSEYDSLSKINSEYGYGALQIANKDRNYTKGELSPFTPEKVVTTIYGKDNKYQDLVEKLVARVKDDIAKNQDPFTKTLLANGTINAKQKRELEEKLTNIATERQAAILNVILNNTTNLVNVQNELNYVFRQLDVVASKLDGSLAPTNEPILYDLSGDTFFNPQETSGSIFDVYTFNVKNTIDTYNKFLDGYDVTKNYYQESTSTIDRDGCGFTIPLVKTFFQSCADNRFYILMTPLFTKSDSLTTLINDLQGGNEIKTNPNAVDQIKQIAETLSVNYNSFQDYWKKQFTDLADTAEYKKSTTWKIPDNTVKTCNYVFPAVGDLNTKTKRIKDLYSNLNLNDNKETFNGKVTFN
jgi:hypothetical protein